jgi:hypothetical protein
MGRFLFADLETAYFGGGRDSLEACDVFGFFAGLPCDDLFDGLLSARGCLEGSVGFSTGDCALSPSVRDSAAARSAARWASWGVDGCWDEAFGGREGCAMGLEFAGGSIEYQSTWPKTEGGAWLTLSLPSCRRREAEVLVA